MENVKKKKILLHCLWGLLQHMLKHFYLIFFKDCSFEPERTEEWKIC